MFGAGAPLWAQPAAPQRTIVYGGDAWFPPYEYLDKSGTPRGFNIEVVKEIARRAGVPIEIRLGRWSERMGALEAGRVDLLSLGYSESRAARYAFLAQTWTLRQGVVFRGGRARYPDEFESGSRRTACSRSHRRTRPARCARLWTNRPTSSRLLSYRFR